MSALAQSYSDSTHHWMLWVAPTAKQKAHINNFSHDDKARCLMLHPKNNEQLVSALETAITSHLYQTITLPKHLMSEHQQKRLEVLALRNHTHIAWVHSQKTLNSASQLSLL